MRQLICALAVTTLAGVGTAAAHHEVPGRSHPATVKVSITQPVLAGGQPLAPGAYEVVITGEHPPAPSGEPNMTQRWVHFVQNGTIVAREVAEVFPLEGRPVGTSGSASARAAVQPLKEGDFVRVAIQAESARYLVHLPVSPR